MHSGMYPRACLLKEFISPYVVIALRPHINEVVLIRAEKQGRNQIDKSFLYIQVVLDLCPKLSLKFLLVNDMFVK